MNKNRRENNASSNREGMAVGSSGAGPALRPIPPFNLLHRQQLTEHSLSTWTPNPVSLPPRLGSADSHHTFHEHPCPSDVPTVPPRTVTNGISDNWVDLEELYRWLQELEDTKVEIPRKGPVNDDGGTGKK